MRKRVAREKVPVRRTVLEFELSNQDTVAGAERAGEAGTEGSQRQREAELKQRSSHCQFHCQRQDQWKCFARRVVAQR